MNPSSLVSLAHVVGDVMICEIFSEHTLGSLVPTVHYLNTKVCLSDHVHPFMTTSHPSSVDSFQEENMPCYKAQVISNWFAEHDSEFDGPKWPSYSPDLNPVEHHRDVVEQEICEQQLCECHHVSVNLGCKCSLVFIFIWILFSWMKERSTCFKV